MLEKAPSFVLGSKESSTYPSGYASGSSSPAALLDGLFEHPDRAPMHPSRLCSRVAQRLNAPPPRVRACLGKLGPQEEGRLGVLRDEASETACDRVRNPSWQAQGRGAF
jgi:hypothetical protein